MLISFFSLGRGHFDIWYYSSTTPLPTKFILIPGCLVYNRDALIMWHRSEPFAVDAADTISYSCNELEASVSSSPSTNDLKLFENLVKWCSQSPADDAGRLCRVIQVLARSAVRWHDVALWFRSTELDALCQGSTALCNVDLLKAFQAFGLRQTENL